MSYLRFVLPVLTALMLASGTQAEEVDSAESVVTAPTPEYQLLWTGPRSLELEIDLRRDALRARRLARSDAFRHLYGISDPVLDHQRDLQRAYADRMRGLYRAHRDAMKFHHDAYLGAVMPWAKARSDLAEARRHAFALESLERQEIMEEERFAYQSGFGVPYAW